MDSWTWGVAQRTGWRASRRATRRIARRQTRLRICLPEGAGWWLWLVLVPVPAVAERFLA